MERNLNYRVGPRRQWKAEEFDGLKPTVYDWCRMAAYLDGEGHLNLNPIFLPKKNQRRIQVRIIIVNTHAALPAWLSETFGGNVCIRPRAKNNPKTKDCYVWSCTAARAAWVLHNSMSWFIMKAPQAKILLAMQEDIDQTRQGRGRTVSEEQWDRRFALKAELHTLLKSVGRDTGEVTVGRFIGE